MTATLHLGNCLDVMRTMPDNSVDSIVTDPPYGLSDHGPAEVAACLSAWLAGDAHESSGGGFMGKKWDAWAPGPEIWREALRVLKPGGHLLAFAGTRSMDLMGMSLRLAGFELRDAIGHAHDGGSAPLLAWTYGSGFPKSHNGPWGGTALKPAWEPVLLARKPLIGTVAANHAEHGTGALNIDGCRIPGGKPDTSGLRGGIPCRHNESEPRAVRNRDGESSADRRYTDSGSTSFAATPGPRGGDLAGRWPANLIHDGSDEVLAGFPDTKSGGKAGVAYESRCGNSEGWGNIGQGFGPVRRADSGSAARFFYAAKASKADRNDGCDGLPLRASGMVSNASGQHITRWDGGAPAPTANNHPTVKPTDLMRYLCRLVTPPGGLVLDPFMGSGSTGRGAVAEGFRFVGIEMDPDYVEIARARIRAMQPGLSLEVA